MIYNHEVMKPFDDRFIRAADQVFDCLYQNNRSMRYEEYQCLSLKQYILEYNTSLLQLPRQVGKSTYLKKLVEYLVKKDKNVLVIVPYQERVKFHRQIENNLYVHSVRSIELVEKFRGTVTTFDFIIADEVKYDKIPSFLYEIEEFLKSDTIVFGLYT